MKRRTFLSLPLACGTRARAQAGRPNIVILLADDLGWADVGYHSSGIRTPNIDRLARQGLELDRFYSYPVCSPTRSGLMTGRSPMRYGVMYSVVRPWYDGGLPVEEHILPQTLKTAGYQTAITGKWHLGHSQVKYLPTSRGFDRAYGHVNGAIDYFTHEREGGLDWNRNGKSVREEGYSTDLLAAEAVQVIKGRDRSKPLFLYVPFNAPHGPLQAPQRLIDRYAGIPDTRRRTFAAMVDGLDGAIGRILTAIDEEKIAENTIVLFFSDNGGPVNLGARNTPLRGAKATTFEGGIRVPAVLRWPRRVKAGAKSAQVMTVLDVFPTLAAAAGVKPANTLPFDGRNLWPTIQSGRSEPREDLFFAVESGARLYLAIIGREWKLVRELARSGESGTNYLFRIEDDATESNDLAAKHPELVHDLVARIEKWRALYPPGGIHETGGPPPGWTAPKEWAEAARP